MKTQRIIPINTVELRRLWLKKLGGLENVSVKNKEWYTLLQEDTRNSLMIEGYFVSKTEILDVIENPKYSKIAYKILGYFEAAVASYELAFQQYKTNDFKISKAIIRQIHSMMFRGDPNFGYSPGEWRKGEMEITGSVIKTSQSFVIENNVEKLINIINDPKIELIHKLAITHNLFEQIHPFPDGNGRVGRILMNFILIAHGLPNIAIKGSEKNKKIYIEALEEADPIIEKFLNENSKANLLSKPLIKLEDLINKSLAISIDIIICNRYDKIEKLLTVNEIAKMTNKSPESLRVACSQKKHICTTINGLIKTHPKLFEEPK